MQMRPILSIFHMWKVKIDVLVGRVNTFITLWKEPMHTMEGTFKIRNLYEKKEISKFRVRSFVPRPQITQRKCRQICS
jgi:hypothetical protein